jgi:DNA (cytosine-5)-methyltransferase 1
MACKQHLLGFFDYQNHQVTWYLRKIGLMGFKFIDLFAGLGGIRIPFEEFGGECVFSSEWDKYAQISYQANHGDIPHGDITKVEVEEIPDFDLLLAGFPCQPFSNAGKKMGFDDTRGTLFFDIARILEAKRPRAIFLENVKGLVSHNKGQTFQTIVRILEEFGYKVTYRVHNAKDYGLPQNRQRIYIVGILSDQPFRFDDPHPLPTRLGDILEDPNNIEPKYTISDRLWSGHKRRKIEHAEKGNGFGFSIFNQDSQYTSTISARYYKDGSEILIEQDAKNPRKLTPREAARLQGFPDDYRIVVSDVQAYKQFGNSVAIPAIRSVAKKLAPLLGGSVERKPWKPFQEKKTPPHI